MLKKDLPKKLGHSTITYSKPMNMTLSQRKIKHNPPLSLARDKTPNENNCPSKSFITNNIRNNLS